MMRVLLLAAVVATATACRYYCRNHLDEPYCCDGGKDYGHPADHDGACPEVRPICTETRGGFEPPNVCPHDGACGLSAKCCFDICLKHHTCKPAQFPIFTIAPPPPIDQVAIYARNGGKKN